MNGVTAASVPDPDLRADALLAALTADQACHRRRDEQRPQPALTDAIARGLARP